MATRLPPESGTLPPVISVVIPARNEERFLRATLASVAAQRYPLDRLECVVVDNGSTDGTGEVAARFAEECPALAVYVVVEPVAGVGRAKNLGASAASGRILIFLDADSRMGPGLARDVADAWERGHPAASIRVAADSSHPVDRGFFALMEFGKIAFGIRSQMMYCDRELFLRLGGFEPSLHLGEDLELLGRIRRYARAHALGTIAHIRSSAIYTSPRRLQTHPYRLGMVLMFARWLLAYVGVARTRRY
jgi:glycosyltransferase involved in cell wall biosynthesis